MGAFALLPPCLIDLLKFNGGFHLERLQLFPHPTFVPGLSPQEAFVPLNTAVTQMSSAAGERRQVVIFSPSQLAEGFSALPVNGGETAACKSSELGCSVQGRQKRVLNWAL